MVHGDRKLDALVRIKRLALAGKVFFTEKAIFEMDLDGLTPKLVIEAILYAPAIAKRLRSRDPESGQAETLYVIKGVTLDGVPVYTKGKIWRQQGQERFYVLISSKRSTDA